MYWLWYVFIDFYFKAGSETPCLLGHAVLCFTDQKFYLAFMYVFKLLVFNKKLNSSLKDLQFPHDR